MVDIYLSCDEPCIDFAETLKKEIESRCNLSVALDKGGGCQRLRLSRAHASSRIDGPCYNRALEHHSLDYGLSTSSWSHSATSIGSTSSLPKMLQTTRHQLFQVLKGRIARIYVSPETKHWEQTIS